MRILLGLVLVLLCFAVSSPAREWSDSSGKFKIQAEVVEITDDSVSLEKDDGTGVIKVPISKLSRTDRLHVNELAGLKRLEELAAAVESLSASLALGETSAQQAIILKEQTSQICEKFSGKTLTVRYRISDIGVLPGSEDVYQLQLRQLATDSDPYPWPLLHQVKLSKSQAFSIERGNVLCVTGTAEVVHANRPPADSVLNFGIEAVGELYGGHITSILCVSLKNQSIRLEQKEETVENGISHGSEYIMGIPGLN